MLISSSNTGVNVNAQPLINQSSGADPSAIVSEGNSAGRKVQNANTSRYLGYTAGFVTVSAMVLKKGCTLGVAAATNYLIGNSTSQVEPTPEEPASQISIITRNNLIAGGCALLVASYGLKVFIDDMILGKRVYTDPYEKPTENKKQKSSEVAETKPGQGNAQMSPMLETDQATDSQSTRDQTSSVSKRQPPELIPLKGNSEKTAPLQSHDESEL